MPTRGEIPAGPPLQLITYDDGIDTDDEWSQFWEDKDYDVDISLIHLSTVKDGEGPPLHFHPYPETIRPVRVGARGLPVDSGQSGLECGGTTLWSVPAIATQRSSETACLKACGVRLFDRAPWLHGHRRPT